MDLFAPSHLLLVLLIILVLFGGSKIPEMMKGLGKGIREFKKAKDELEDDEAIKKNGKLPPSDSTKKS